MYEIFWGVYGSLVLGPFATVNDAELYAKKHNRNGELRGYRIRPVKMGAISK